MGLIQLADLARDKYLTTHESSEYVLPTNAGIVATRGLSESFDPRAGREQTAA